MAEASPEKADQSGEISQDRLLDGRLLLSQPTKGHRAGSDAVLLAAALPVLGEGPLLDMGAGVGTVGLAAALMQAGLRVVLLERDREIAGLARDNAAANGLDGRVRVVAAAVEARATELSGLGLMPASFACVAMNPPFHAAGETRASLLPNRRAAHVVDGSLEDWFRAARHLLRPGGRIVLIHRAQALAQVLAGLRGFGGVVVRPVHAAVDRPAIRILVAATLGSRKPAALLPAFGLNAPEGGFTEIAEAVHRGRARLDMGES